MNGERQMLPVHTTRIRAWLPMTKIPSAHDCELGDGGGGHGLDRSVALMGLLPSGCSTALDSTGRGCPQGPRGRIEAIRTLHVASSSANNARSQATNQLKALLVTAPVDLREQLRHLSSTTLVAAFARLRPDADIADPDQATKTALRRVAHRHQNLSEGITGADTDPCTRVTAAARLLGLPGVGTEVAGQILVTAGDNPDRLRSEAAFAHLCGVARSQPEAGAPTATDSTAAATGVRTTPCTLSCSDDYVTTPAPGPTPPDEPPRGCPSPRSSDALSASPPASCSPRSRPAQPTINPAGEPRRQRRLDMTTGPARCLYALRPADRPGCLPTATVSYGGIAVLRVRPTAAHPPKRSGLRPPT
jgi:hypothetical protein